jgi:superfamily II DNA or RNA helicase
MTTKTKQARSITLRDRLSRLTFKQACKLLGDEGKQAITEGGRYDDIDIDRDVYLRGDLFRLALRGAAADGGDVRVSLTLMSSRVNRLHWNCDHCETLCEHVGAAFSLVLDDKYALGLSEIPKEGVPLERLSEEELVQRALAERVQRARHDKFRLRSSNPETPWTDYLVTSGSSGKTYRVVLRGEAPGSSYCTCPDFRVNTLGTCKHILYTMDRVRQKFPADLRRKPQQPRDFMVHLNYGETVTLRMECPTKLTKAEGALVKRLTSGPIQDLQLLLRCISKLEKSGREVVVYPDAEQWIQQQLFEQRISRFVAEIRANPAGHALRTQLLKVDLLPYQLDGIAFAVGAGRAILADDMGLGKTIQGIGVAELLSRWADIRRVLIVCPASLKSQWRSEIHRFSERDCQLVIGSAEDRFQQYDNDAFFTICNYEQVLRDLQPIEQVPWDLIILDEGQRIKNWESKTSSVIKSLRSNFALVLSGTPLENRLDELYSVVQFIDDRRLAPAFRFFHRHRVVDERGKVIGYKNLDTLRENLRPILLRRTRDSVLEQLPDRTTEIVRIPPTDQQRRLSDENVALAAQIASKKFITEMDILRIQKALLMARMAADSTFLVNKEAPGFSSKLEYLDGFLEQLFGEPQRKGVVFSEWTTMLNLIEPLLRKHQLDYVRLDGSVPQKKRQQLVNRFQEHAECKVFLTTNAGSTGLNLQAANTVVNVDLPWNPAVLEQRVARAHRMGQRRPVDVYLLVTELTFEERLLGTLADKQNLALAVLDADAEVSEVDFQSNVEEMRRRLELLLGSRPTAPVDRVSQQRAEREVEHFGTHRQRVAQAGGELLGAVFSFLGELVSDGAGQDPPKELVHGVQERLRQCVDEQPDGRQQLTFSLPNRESLDGLAHTLAKLLSVDESEG